MIQYEGKSSLMKVYLVGGAVRDRLLGIPVKECDWVVVGSTPEQLLQLNYRQVGRDFLFEGECRQAIIVARANCRSLAAKGSLLDHQ